MRFNTFICLILEIILLNFRNCLINYIYWQVKKFVIQKYLIFFNLLFNIYQKNYQQLEYPHNVNSNLNTKIFYISLYIHLEKKIIYFIIFILINIIYFYFILLRKIFFFLYFRYYLINMPFYIIKRLIYFYCF